MQAKGALHGRSAALRPSPSSRARRGQSWLASGLGLAAESRHLPVFNAHEAPLLMATVTAPRRLTPSVPEDRGRGIGHAVRRARFSFLRPTSLAGRSFVRFIRLIRCREPLPASPWVPIPSCHTSLAHLATKATQAKKGHLAYPLATLLRIFRRPTLGQSVERCCRRLATSELGAPRGPRATISSQDAFYPSQGILGRPRSRRGPRPTRPLQPRAAPIWRRQRDPAESPYLPSLISLLSRAPAGPESVPPSLVWDVADQVAVR
jgi:hypothetical protein